jgi:hypothetical protein
MIRLGQLKDVIPQPGLTANKAYCRGVGVMLQVLKDQTLTMCKRHVYIVRM